MPQIGFARAIYCILAVLCCAASSYCQDATIETDRDSFTRSPRTVGAGRVVVEGSYTFMDQDAEFEGHLYPDLLARYGAKDWLELRLSWTYEVGKLHHLAATGAERTEEGLLIYGAKTYLTDAEGWMPDSSLIVSGYTPTSGESNDTDFSLEYAFGWKSGEGWEIDGGLRWFTLADEEDHFTEWAPSVVVKGPVGSERWLAHVEYFGLLSVDRDNNYVQHYAGPGIHHLITPDWEIGVRVFWGLSDDSANFICNAGSGLRF
ncbi:MAG: transporter [Planctomycetaceae bacterium]|nr:transporter [Planctomycetales bacterium]MCB9927767.1 transporter [Planctomycetaceae bacterium]